MKKYFAVLGHPVSHSLSPVIHQAFALSLGIDIVYEKIEVSPDKLSETLKAFRGKGGMGANITLPFKQEAFKLCQHLMAGAKQSKTVNTLGWENEALWGENTDGEGFIRDLTHNKGISLKDKRVLILGAGGAAQGILPHLLNPSPERIVIVNRHLEKAQLLCNTRVGIEAFSYENLSSLLPPFDIVVNATSASLFNTLPPLDPYWIKNTFAIDLAYRFQGETSFVKWAKEAGAKEAHDGMGMLVEQAALSFQKWHQVLPQTQSVIESLSVSSQRDFNNLFEKLRVV